MHSVNTALRLTELINHESFGLMLDMAHVCQAVLGTNMPEHGFLPPDWLWNRDEFDEAVGRVVTLLGPKVNCFHVAQTTLETFASGGHAKTGRHALPDDPNGKLDIPAHAGLMSKAIPGGLAGLGEITWDSCMIGTSRLDDSATWDRILQSMFEVQQQNGGYHA